MRQAGTTSRDRFAVGEERTGSQGGNGVAVQQVLQRQAKLEQELSHIRQLLQTQQNAPPAVSPSTDVAPMEAEAPQKEATQPRADRSKLRAFFD